MPLLLALLLMFTAVTSASAEVTVVSGEIPRMYAAQVFYLTPSQSSDLSGTFQRMKNRGVDTILLRAFHNSTDRVHGKVNNSCASGVYFNTASACVVDPLIERAVATAHALDMKIYGWMATRSLSFLKSGDMLEKSFLPEGGTGDGYGADIFHPDVRTRITRLFADLAATGVDGILMQDDFIMKYTEGAKESTMNRFFQENMLANGGVELFFSGTKVYNGKEVFSGYTPLFTRWAEWKNRSMIQFAKELRQAALSVNPALRFAGNVYYETPIEPEKGLAWYAQTLSGFDEAGFDYYAVMGYQEQLARERGMPEEESVLLLSRIAAAAAEKAGNSSRVVLKLQARRFTKEREPMPLLVLKQGCSVPGQYGISVAFAPVEEPEDVLAGCN